MDRAHHDDDAARGQRGGGGFAAARSRRIGAAVRFVNALGMPRNSTACRCRMPNRCRRKTMDNEAPSRLVAPPQIAEDAMISGEQGSGPPMGEPYVEGGGYPDGQFDGGRQLRRRSMATTIPGTISPAPIESSGTWLNRGVWYAEADAMILHRIWQRGDTFVGAEDQNVIVPNPANPSSVGLAALTRIARCTFRRGIRAETRACGRRLGRFLFRDDHNRDHTAEFTAWAAGDWVSDGVMTSDSPNDLFVTFNLDGGNQLFDRSSSATRDLQQPLEQLRVELSPEEAAGPRPDGDGSQRQLATRGGERLQSQLSRRLPLRPSERNAQLDGRGHRRQRRQRPVPDQHRQRSVRVPDGRRARIRIRPLERRHFGQGWPVLERRRLRTSK